MTQEEKEKGAIQSVIELKHLFRVKGYSGIHTPRSKPNSNGMIGMKNWKTNKPVIVHKSMLIGLNGIGFLKLDGSSISLAEGFDNMYDHYGERLVELKEVERSVICPDYDEDEFKTHHLKHVVAWYNEVIEKAILNNK